MAWKASLTWPPSVATTPTMTAAISATSIPYSTAGAPRSSRERSHVHAAWNMSNIDSPLPASWASLEASSAQTRRCEVSEEPGQRVEEVQDLTAQRGHRPHDHRGDQHDEHRVLDCGGTAFSTAQRDPRDHANLRPAASIPSRTTRSEHEPGRAGTASPGLMNPRLARTPRRRARGSP